MFIVATLHRRDCSLKLDLKTDEIIAKKNRVLPGIDKLKAFPGRKAAVLHVYKICQRVQDSCQKPLLPSSVLFQFFFRNGDTEGSRCPSRNMEN